MPRPKRAPHGPALAAPEGQPHPRPPPDHKRRILARSHHPASPVPHHAATAARPRPQKRAPLLPHAASPLPPSRGAAQVRAPGPGVATRVSPPPPA